MKTIKVSLHAKRWDYNDSSQEIRFNDWSTIYNQELC